jgi:hypothetical protein
MNSTHVVFSVPILIFFLGIVASVIRSDLSIPTDISKFIALYLLFSIGFQGGVELSHNVWNIHQAIPMLVGLVMAGAIPLYVFYIAKRHLSLYNAAALAASYGSISVVTFLTAISYLNDVHIPYGGYMIALMALMEFPAILIGLFLVKKYAQQDMAYTASHICKDVFKNGAIVILIGGLLIGCCSHASDIASLKPFLVGIQRGFLLFFLLDKGILVGSKIVHIRRVGIYMIALGIGIPLINVVIGCLCTYCFHINSGDGLLLTILLCSASYIAVPATFNLTVPQADPGVYLTPAVLITFPFNMMMIPVYGKIINYLTTLSH